MQAQSTAVRGFTLSALYRQLAISKQAVWQHRQRHSLQATQAEQLIAKAEAIRQQHPAMGCRKISHLLKEEGWGRDKVEQLLLAAGFRVCYPPNYCKTTHSIRIHQFKNLIEGLSIREINKVVQTDITYYFIGGKFYYLVFIIDIYSRRIVGSQASENMEAASNEQALKELIRLRGKEGVKNLIHHSDRGSQYHSKKYLSLLQEHAIKISMCEQAWENAYTERINKTMKEEYLNHYKMNGLADLKTRLRRSVKLYNESRPHWSLALQTPVAFEAAIEKMRPAKRPVVEVYKPAPRTHSNTKG